MGKRVLFGAAVFVLVVAYAALYFQGLDFGRPFQLHADERWVVDIALDIAKSGDYNPHFLEYPSLPIYMQLGISCLTHVRMVGKGAFRNAAGDPENRTIDKLTPRDEFEHYYAGRLWMAVLAGATIVMVYFVAAELLGSAAALFAAAATLSSSLFLEQAHYVTPNLYMTFFSLATLYACLRYVRSGDLRTIYLGAVMAGLAIGSKYPVFVVLLPVFASVAWKLRLRAWKHVIGLFLTASVMFVLTTPYALLDLPQFLASLGVVSLQYLVVGVVEARTASIPPPLRYVLTVWNAGPVLTFCAVVGFIALPFVRNYRRFTLMVLFAIPYCVLVMDSKVVYPRNLTPILPIRAIAAAAVVLALWHIASGGKVPGSDMVRRPRFAAFCCAILIACCLWRPINRSILITQEFSRPAAFQAADAWFESEVPQSANIASDHYLTCPAVPCPGGKHQVGVIQGAHFSSPYMSYINSDYLVTSAGGAYDGTDWARKYYFENVVRNTRPADPNYIEAYLTRNRRLAETRLPSVKVFDSTPRGHTEVALNCEVVAYKMPRYEVIDWRGRPLASGDGSDAVVVEGSIGHIETQFKMKPGEYDVFVEAKQNTLPSGKYADNPPSVTCTIAGLKTEVNCRFIAPACYFVTSMSTTMSGPVSFTVDTPENCPIFRICLVRAGGPVPDFANPATPVTLFGENLIANSDFDRRFLRWKIDEPSADFAPSISNDAAQGSRSLALALAPSYNIGIWQAVPAVTPSAEYLLTGYIACSDLDGEARLEVQDAQNGWKSFCKWTNSVSGTKTWERVGLRFKVPDHVTNLLVMLRRPVAKQGTHEKGAVWFDNIRLHRIASP